MFELTSRAAAALADARARKGLADKTAIRISASKSGNGSSATQRGYQLRFASRPAPDDLMVEQAGTKVFLAADLAEPLEASVLDMVDTERGKRLVLRRRRAPKK